MAESLGTSVKVTDTETGIITIYPSKGQAAKELNTSLDTVRRYIVSNKPLSPSRGEGGPSGDTPPPRRGKAKYLIENLIEN
jgi:NUMOD1 domain